MKPRYLLAAILCTLALYPISVGPVVRLEAMVSRTTAEPFSITIPSFYWPVFSVCQKSQITARALDWYLQLWLPVARDSSSARGGETGERRFAGMVTRHLESGMRDDGRLSLTGGLDGTVPRQRAAMLRGQQLPDGPHQRALFERTEIWITIVIWSVINAAIANCRGQSPTWYFFFSLVAPPAVTLNLLFRRNPERVGYTIPRRTPGDGPINELQRKTLMRLGVTQWAVLDGISGGQAEKLIHQLRIANRPDYKMIVTAVILFPMACYMIYTRILFPPDSNALSGGGTGAAPQFHLPHFNLPGGEPASTPEPSPAPRVASGPLTILKPVVVQSRYGKVTIPAGAHVTLVSAGNGQLQIQYAGDTVVVPIAATNYTQ